MTHSIIDPSESDLEIMRVRAMLDERILRYEEEAQDETRSIADRALSRILATHFAEFREEV